MPIVQTARDLGFAIRSRRRALGWDQAKLAKQVGVTRQWVIDIEKGKPRAELALAMRALRALGLSLIVEAKPDDVVSQGGSGAGRGADATPPYLDIDAIVGRNRGSAAGRLAELPQLHRPGAVAGDLKEIDATTRRLIPPAGSNVAPPGTRIDRRAVKKPVKEKATPKGIGARKR